MCEAVREKTALHVAMFNHEWWTQGTAKLGYNEGREESRGILRDSRCAKNMGLKLQVGGL